MPEAWRVITASFVLSLGSAALAVADESNSILFPMKAFVDTGQIIHIEGTLSGDGIGYRNNTSGLTCYKMTQECEFVLVNSHGLQVFSMGIPVLYTVRVWEKDRIVADFSAPCGKPPNPAFAKEWQASVSETWIIDRARETAELDEHPCNDPKLYHWTIENSSYWQKQLVKTR